jgi:hypothetical protein
MNNPLSAYFRQPKLFVRLPSEGRHWAEGSISIPASLEIPVMSMTAGDEILMKTPEALLNGQATVSLIQNCFPNVHNAWATPITDLESMLLAIRIASVGEHMELELTCPKCSEEQNYQLDLKQQLENFDAALWDQQLTIDQLTFVFKPIDYTQHTEFSNRMFQNQKKLQQASSLDDPDHKEHVTNEVIMSINQLEADFVIDSIVAIKVESNTVTDREYIAEFLMNCEKKIYDQLFKHVLNLRNSTRQNQLTVVCPSCEHEYTTEFSLDYASFFELSS